MTSRPIHQLVHTLSYGDAISTEVLALQEALRAFGVASEIYALHEHNRYGGRSRHFSKIHECSEADIILHYSIGSPLNDAYRTWGRGQRILVYHNITPPRWFRGINNNVAVNVDQGLRDLPVLCATSDRIWADSNFNAAEIAALGFMAEVLPLSLPAERWKKPRNEEMFARVSACKGINILHVGRVAPNKCIEDVIKAFYYTKRYIKPESTLWLAGIDTDTELYSFSLQRLARGLGILDSVHFLGGRTDEEIRALYEACSVYVCMSEHEGFCLPLIEAMHFGLPVVGFDAGAVRETIGDGGIVVAEKRHAEIGALLAHVALNEPLRRRLVTSGGARVAHFSPESFRERLQCLLAHGSGEREACRA